MRAIAFSLVLAGAVIVPMAAHANPTCTTEPKGKWMSEEAIKARIAALGYHSIRSFKVTESCYEIYGSNKENKLVEVYFNPITGDIVPSEVPVMPSAK
ncbi:MAG TPA: PepSY domain-containing protein [Bradyrhizobium sp.]